MRDSYIQFDFGKQDIKLAKKLGFVGLDSASSFKVLKKYDKQKLLSAIKSLNYDLILNLEEEPKVFTSGLAKLAGERKVGVLLLLNKII